MLLRSWLRLPCLALSGLILSLGAAKSGAAPFEAAPAINALGLDLYREQIKNAQNEGVLLSPYSIATALAMTYAGADGETQKEMQKVLRLPKDATQANTAFQELAKQLADAISASEKEIASFHEPGAKTTPIQLTVANRIFLQRGFALRPAYVQNLSQYFDSTLAELDFKNDASSARHTINQWVAGQTHDRITDLLPPGQPTPETRLTLVNALYLKAPWKNAFEPTNTKPEPFFLAEGEPISLPTMFAEQKYGYVKYRNHTVVTVPYLGELLQLVLFIPKTKDGLADLERSLTANAFTECRQLPVQKVRLHLPKFKLEPALMPLASALQKLGLQTAFDLPKGSANFDRMAPRRPDAYLALGDIYHKTWLSLDEEGTEAVAATSVEELALFGGGPRREPPPIVVRADRPFLFAIQHVKSGACLFLGRVTDPQTHP